MSVGIIGQTGALAFENVLHDSIHESCKRNRVNYSRCPLCNGEMLRDSCTPICDRPMCREFRKFLCRQSTTFRENFWKQVGYNPPLQNARSLYTLEELMGRAMGEAA
jgi:hypothetical protein